MTQPIRFRTVLATLALALPSTALAAPWEIDDSHSAAQFSVRHMMVTNVRGDFSKVTGVVNVDDKDPKKSTVEATIDAATINTRVAKRDEHLRSADFFDVAKHPSITFKSTQVKPKGSDKYQVIGDLTLHGVTRPVTLEVEATPEQKSPFGDVRRGLQATSKISRKEFGLTWNKAMDAGGVVVGDDIAITLDLELVRKNPVTK